MTDVPSPEDVARITSINADTDYLDLIAQLRAATPAQIKTYVQNNTVGLPTDARILIAKIVLILSRTI